MKRFGIALLAAAVLAVAVAAVAGAFAEGDSGDTGLPSTGHPAGPPVTGAAQQKASAAALRATGGGTVLVVTRDPTEHAAYAVDVREASDQIVEVRLDRNYKPIGSETLQSPNDGGD